MRHAIVRRTEEGLPSLGGAAAAPAAKCAVRPVSAFVGRARARARSVSYIADGVGCHVQLIKRSTAQTRRVAASSRLEVRLCDVRKRRDRLMNRSLEQVSFDESESYRHSYGHTGSQVFSPYEDM